MRPLPNAENQISASVILVWRRENEKKLKTFISFLKERFQTQDN